MSAATFGKGVFKPAGVIPGPAARVRLSRPPRSFVVSAVAGEANDNSHSRRKVLSASFIAGLGGLLAKKAVAGDEILSEIPETVLDVGASDEVVAGAIVEAVTEEIVADAAANVVEQAIDVADVKDNEANSSSPDPTLLAGGAAALVALFGAASALSSGSSEELDIQEPIAEAPAAQGAGFEEEDLAKVAEAESELNERKAALNSLNKEIQNASSAVVDAATAQGAAFECLINYSREAAMAEFEVQVARAEYEKAKKTDLEAEQAASKQPSGLSNVFGSFGKNESADTSDSKATEAEFKCRAAAVLASEAALADRRAWIGNWRASKSLSEAKATLKAKTTEVSVLSAQVQTSEQNLADLKRGLGLVEAKEEVKKVAEAAPAADIVVDAVEQIDEAATVQPVAVGTSSEPEQNFEDRLADRREWIAAWKVKQQDAAAAASPGDTMEERQAERRAWIAAWRAKTTQLVEA